MIKVINSKRLKLILSAGIILSSLTTAFAVVCQGQGSFNDGTLSGTANVYWSTDGDDCCSSSSGYALVNYEYYVNGTSAGGVSYYISVAEAQYAAGCSGVA